MITIKCLAVGFSLAILIFVIELVRREKLTFKYAFGWIVATLAAIFFTIFDNLLFQISAALGFTLTSNFIFFGLLSMFVFLSLLLTVFLCQQDRRNQRIAQRMGILENEQEQLAKRIKKD